MELLKKKQLKETECIHDPNSSNSTLVKVPKRYLVHPEVLDFYCPLCNGIYRFQKEGTTFCACKGINKKDSE